MKVYAYAASAQDPRAAHDSGVAIPASTLEALGVLTYHFDALADVEALAQQRAYKNRDVITVSPAAMGEAVYQQKLQMFFAEHLHEDEEIRYILDGAGYFDVRPLPEEGAAGVKKAEEKEEEEGGEEEGWVRIRMEKGDLAILPAGIYHRFCPDEQNYTKAMRLFKEEPKWTPLNRAPELDENPYRKRYVESLKKRGPAAVAAS